MQTTTVMTETLIRQWSMQTNDSCHDRDPGNTVIYEDKWQLLMTETPVTQWSMQTHDSCHDRDPGNTVIYADRRTALRWKLTSPALPTAGLSVANAGTTWLSMPNCQQKHSKVNQNKKDKQYNTWWGLNSLPKSKEKVCKTKQKETSLKLLMLFQSA